MSDVFVQNPNLPLEFTFDIGKYDFTVVFSGGT